jgi:N-acetylglutamate synthase-like GNAT family acetyltransferase
VVVMAHETEGFFRKFDFAEIRLDRLPASVRDSVEVKFAAADSTTAMLLRLSMAHEDLTPARQSVMTP